MKRSYEVLVTWRTDRGLTQADMAKMAGVHQSALSMIERGLRKPSIDQAFRLERVSAGAVPASLWPDWEKLRQVKPYRAAA